MRRMLFLCAAIFVGWAAVVPAFSESKSKADNRVAISLNNLELNYTIKFPVSIDDAELQVLIEFAMDAADIREEETFGVDEH